MPATPRVTIATFEDYAAAQKAVDHLSDNHFPVERVAIVGTGLKLVEQVTGRLTLGRAALGGLATGAWIGLFIGLLLGIFSVSDWWKVLLYAVLIGAFWGAIFGLVAHAFTRGQRDFSSVSALKATHYDIMVDADSADAARQQLAGLPTA